MSKDHTLLRVIGALTLIVGFGASITGLLALVAIGTSVDGPPECDGEVMQPGDSCWTQFGGEREVSTYEEIMQRKESGEGERQVGIAGGVGLGGGVVLLLGSEWIRRRVRRYNLTHEGRTASRMPSPRQPEGSNGILDERSAFVRSDVGQGEIAAWEGLHVLATSRRGWMTARRLVVRLRKGGRRPCRVR